MPLAQGRDWSPIIERIERAADDFPNLSAVVWFNVWCRFDFANPLLPPVPPVALAKGVLADTSGATATTRPDGWGLMLLPHDPEPAAATALSQLAQLAGVVCEGSVREDGRPMAPTDYLLTLVGDAAGGKQCAVRVGDEYRWLPASPAFWRGREMPDWWCVAVPHLFQRLADYLRAIPTVDDAPPLSSPLIERCGGLVRTSRDLAVVHVGGQAFHLSSEARRDVARLLIERWEAGTPDVRKEELLEAADTDQGDLREVFRSGNPKANAPAWGGVVVLSKHPDGRQRRGWYRLNITDPGAVSRRHSVRETAP